MNILKKKAASDKSNWVADEDVKECPLCKTGFSLTRRRHHCRKCGGVFCGDCTGSTAVLQKGNKAERVCNPCFQALLKADEKSNQEAAAKQKEDEQKKSADTNFVIHIYDKEGLIHDIVKWLKGKVVVDVVATNVKVPCNVFINGGNLCFQEIEIPQSKEAKEAAAAAEEQPKVPLQEAIPLADFHLIRLGATKQLKSVLGKNEGTQCFTIDCSKSLKCNGKQSVGFVCRELADFEAWVLGLCHLTRITPSWDQPSKIEKALAKTLTPEEVAHLQRHQISTETYKKAKRVILQRKDDIKHHLWVHDGDVKKAWSALGRGNVKPFLDEHGGVFCTKGELRHITGIDIFRACSLWELMQAQRLVFDPNYIPAVGEGSEAAAVRKKPAPQQRQEYRIDPQDGNAYTKQQFIDEYGGTAEWDTAKAYNPDAHRQQRDQQKAAAAAAATPADAVPPPPPPPADEPAAPPAQTSPKHVDPEPEPAPEADAEASPEEEGLSKAEKKRLKKILFANVTAVIAIVTQAAYEEKRAAKKAKKAKKQVEEAEAEAEAEEPAPAGEEDEDEERERRRREKKAKKEKKRREREEQEAEDDA